MEILAIMTISFIVISLMMLGIGVGLLFDRNDPGKTCGTQFSGMTEESCCNSASRCADQVNGDNK